MCDLFIDELKVVETCGVAPLGALLQVRIDDGSVVYGMRCETMVGAVPMPCLLLLTGADRGLLLEGGLVHRPALNVSSLFDIQVKEPAPVVYGQQHYQLAGVVCESEAGSGLFFVRAKLQSNTRAYVLLRDPIKNEPTGTVHHDAPPNMWLLGPTDVARKPSPILRADPVVWGEREPDLDVEVLRGE